MYEYQDLINNLDIIGIPSIEKSDIQNSKSLLQMLTNKADEFKDLGSDYRITICGSSVNIGKDVMEFFSSQYKQIKGDL